MKEREALTFKILFAAQNSGQCRSVKLQSGKLCIDGTLYDNEDYPPLPIFLRPASVTSPRNTTAVVFFSKHSPLSNHFITDFTLEGVHNTSIEQFLTKSWAEFARNSAMAHKAMTTDEPVEHKKMLNALKGDGKEASWRNYGKFNARLNCRNRGRIHRSWPGEYV